MAQSVAPRDPAPAVTVVQPHGSRLRLRTRVRVARLCRAQARPERADDRLAGVVAGGLRSLRAAVHPHGVAQRRHLSHRRRPRWRGQGQPAVRTARCVARQRQPRQGAPPAVADQAEVRPQDLVGRSDDPRGQRRARVDGIQDVRVRRRPRGHLRARDGRLLGLREEVARGQALLRRPRAREAARRGPDGPDLRQPGRSERQARPARGRARYPRDVRADGDER